MNIRKAAETDITAVAELYEKIHTAEEHGDLVIGWQRGIYPVRKTALAALDRNDLFVMEEDSGIIGAGIINQTQVDVYAQGHWKNKAEPSEVMVLHTLVIDPELRGKGNGTAFVRFYEDYAARHGCPYLRIDTNERNAAARRLYHGLGYEEIGIVPCVFNGLRDVKLVLLEKSLRQ